MRQKLVVMAAAIALGMTGTVSVLAVEAPPAQAAATYSWVASGGYWYLYGDGKVLYGWQKWEGHWYYLEPGTGHMYLGWQKINGDWYYLTEANQSGSAHMGWLTWNGSKYYLDPAGESGRLFFGWHKIDGYWYYFNPANESGAMMTGWQKINGGWYYLEPGTGHMLLGWQKINGDWYYLDEANESGRAHMGWLDWSGGRFYLDPAGESGRAFFGWHKIDGNWYYFDPTNESGRLLTSITGGDQTQRDIVHDVAATYAGGANVRSITLNSSGHLGETYACTNPSDIKLNVASMGHNTTQIKMVLVHEIMHAMQNTVYPCLYNMPEVYNRFGGFEKMTDAMTVAITGSTAYLNYQSQFTPEQLRLAGLVARGTRI